MVPKVQVQVQVEDHLKLGSIQSVRRMHKFTGVEVSTSQLPLEAAFFIMEVSIFSILVEYNMNCIFMQREHIGTSRWQSLLVPTL